MPKSSCGHIRNPHGRIPDRCARTSVKHSLCEPPSKILPDMTLTTRPLVLIANPVGTLSITDIGVILPIHAPMEVMTTTDNGAAPLSLERLKALSDGVFAIVITTLVLELEVPETHDFSESGILAFLLKIEHQVLPYIASFALTAGYWVLHHVMLDSISRSDRYFLWLNLLFMLPLTLAPFVTGMSAEYPGEIGVAAIFGAVQLANFLLLLVI